MRAGPSCATLSGTTHASIENSPVAWIIECSLALALVAPCALPSLIRMPQEPTHSTLPIIFRSRAGSMPLVSKATEPVPVLNSYSAMAFESNRPPVAAIIPSGKPSARLVIKVSSTSVTGISSANAVISSSMRCASAVQLPDQQLWNSSPRRVTNLDSAGVSIFMRFFAAWYATSRSLLPRKGCC